MQLLKTLPLIFVIGCSSFSKDSGSAALYVDLAKNQLQKGQAPAALANLLKAEKMDANNPQLHNQFGLTYFVFKKYDKSIEHFKRAIQEQPSFTEARNNYSRALIEVGQYSEAREELKLVINDLTYTNQAAANANFGLSYFREGNFKAAIPFLQKSIRQHKNSCQSYNLYARSLYELKDYSGAIPVFDAAVPLCKKQNLDEAHYFAALTYFKSGDKNKGMALMNETILHYSDGSYQDKAKSMLELMKLNKL